jgi:hypothetical protein
MERQKAFNVQPSTELSEVEQEQQLTAEAREAAPAVEAQTPASEVTTAVEPTSFGTSAEAGRIVVEADPGQMPEPRVRGGRVAVAIGAVTLLPLVFGIGDSGSTNGPVPKKF